MESSLNDTLMLKTAIIISIIGLTILFVLMFFRSEYFISISDVDSYIEQKILLKGEIKNISYKNNNTRFFLVQECEIEVIAFNYNIYNNINDNIIFNKNNFNNINNNRDKNKSNEGKYISLYAVVSGKIQEYKGRKSIIADKISLIEKNESN